jgi:fumarate reductase subunit C
MSGPRPYVRELPKTTWFLSSARYKTYMLHEVSSIFVALYMALLIYGLFALGSGPSAWQGFLDFVRNPIVVILSLIALALFLIHTTSWFKAVPQAMRLMRGTEVVPGSLLVRGHYAVFAGVSLFILALAALG